MKTNWFYTTLSLCVTLMFAPLAFGGPNFSNRITQPAHHNDHRGSVVNPAVCCVQHAAGSDKSCCTAVRLYYSDPSGRGLTWKQEPDCTKTSAVTYAEQRPIRCKREKA